MALGALDPRCGIKLVLKIRNKGLLLNDCSTERFDSNRMKEKIEDELFETHKKVHFFHQSE
jgi:hypothetical protein